MHVRPILACLRHELGGADVAGHEPAGAPADGALRPVLLPRQLVALHAPRTQRTLSTSSTGERQAGQAMARSKQAIPEGSGL